MAAPDDPVRPATSQPLLHAAWARLGNTKNYVEPFGLGLFTVLLTRPASHQWWRRLEAVNDPRGGISNLFRALDADPDATAAAFADADLQPQALPPTMDDRLRADPFWRDTAAAGQWASAVTRPLHTPGHSHDPAVELRALANRLRRVRGASGKWQRLLGRPSKTDGRNITAVLMEPPTPHSDADDDARRQALAWSLDHGTDPQYRIAHTARPDEAAALYDAGWDNHDHTWYSPHCAPAGQPEDPENTARAPVPKRLANRAR